MGIAMSSTYVTWPELLSLISNEIEVIELGIAIVTLWTMNKKKNE